MYTEPSQPDANRTALYVVCLVSSGAAANRLGFFEFPSGHAWLLLCLCWSRPDWRSGRRALKRGQTT